MPIPKIPDRSAVPDGVCHRWFPPDWMAAWMLACCLPGLSLVASCSSGSPPTSAQSGAQTLSQDAFVLNVLEESIFDRARFRLDVEEDEGAANVTVTATDAANLKGVYLELTYDPEQYTPGAVNSYGVLNALGTPLTLSVISAPGLVQHGEVLANWPGRDGFSGSGAIASFHFRQISGEEPGVAAKIVSTVPGSDKAEHFLNFNPKSSVFLWYYVNPGDYDQNGEVGITDLTPLGANFNAEGPFAVTSARSVIDGDGNGVISIADITPIGANFGNAIDDFAIYGSADAADYPSSNTGANGAGSQLKGTRALSLAKGGGALRKYWDLVMDVPIIGTGHYWQRPVSLGAEGTPSQLVSHTQQWHVDEIYSYASPGAPVILRGFGMESINAKPSILLNIKNVDTLAVDFMYLSALDEVGSTWNPPITAMSTVNLHYGAGLKEVDGRPAFAWKDDDLEDGIRYMRAANAQGTAWLPPKVVDSSSESGNGGFLMLEYKSKPAVIENDGGLQLKLKFAADADGTAWGSSIDVFDGNTGAFDAIRVPGGIAIIRAHYQSGEVTYAFAKDTPLGIDIGEEQVLIAGNNSGAGFLHLGFSGGAPYMVRYSRDDGRLLYSYGTGVSAVSWSPPVVPAGLTGEIGLVVSAVAYGVPWICYTDGIDEVIKAGHFAESASNDWINEASLPENNLTTYSLSMSTAGIHPALAWDEPSEKSVYFAVYY